MMNTNPLPSHQTPSLSSEELITLLNTLEKRYSVSEWRVNSHHLWPLIRIMLYSRLKLLTVETTPVARMQAHRHIPFFSGLLVHSRNFMRGVSHTLCDWRNHEFLQPCDVLFLTNTICRRTKIAGRYYDSFCDPFREYLEIHGKSSLCLEYSARDTYRLPRYRGSHFLSPELAWQACCSRMTFTASLYPEVQAYLASTLAYFRECGIEFSEDFSQNAMKEIHYYKTLINFFARLLQRVRPKVVFLVYYYGLVEMALVSACAEQQICSVDIQHGVQGEFHPAYGRWGRIPPTGFDALPSIFWCWSKEEATAIAHWSDATAGAHTPYIGGNLFLQMFRDSQSAVVQEYELQVRQHISAHATVCVLLTLQTDCGGLIPLFIRIIQESPSSWFWWIRLHPGMRKDLPTVEAQGSVLSRDRYYLDDATLIPIHSILRICQAHITLYSSTVLEAEQFGVKSMICHQTGVNYFPEQLSNGSAMFCATVEEALAQLAVVITEHSQADNIQSQQPAGDTLGAFFDRYY